MSMYENILAKYAEIMKKLAQVNASEQKIYNVGYEKGKAEGGGDDSLLRSLIDRNIVEIEIPYGVTKIGNYAFCGCGKLVKLTIPDSVTEIGTHACNGIGLNYGVDEVIIPNSVTTIGANAFVWSGVKKFVISKNIARIEANTFGGCSKCEVYDFTRHESVPELVNVNAFDQMTTYKKAKIYVPDLLYAEWIEATNWAAYADYIVGVGLKAVPNQDSFNIYVDANTLQEIVNYDVLGIKLGHGVGENYIRNEGGMPYLRIHGDGVSNEAYAIVQNVNKQKTGKYLVYAYRIPTSNTYSGQHYFQIYANTTNDTPSGKGDMFYVRAYQDGNWHVDIIDIEAAINSSSSVVVDKNPSKFTPSNGEYITRKLRFDWFNVDWTYGHISTSDYIDIAYIALCDSLELARAADPDYTGKEFSPEYFASRLGSEIEVTESGMKYAVVNATTYSSGESWIWLSEDKDNEYRIIPNTTMYVGVLYKDAPVRANGKGAWGEIYACSANDSLTNSYWYSLGRIDPYDTSSGWHFGIMKFKAPLADAACRLMRFDFFNGLEADKNYTMDIAFVKCFTSEEEANAYYQGYKTQYGI